MAGEGNSPISADNINFLSGVSLDYDINILSSDDSVFSFELVLTQINANILGSDQRTEIVPSAGRNSLYTLTVSVLIYNPLVLKMPALVQTWIQISILVRL